jgi:calcineurin-like phosphoesterase family protein
MVYVAADLSFKKDEARDREIIENWNRYIQDEDFVLLFGEITVSKEATSIKKIFDNLKG